MTTLATMKARIANELLRSDLTSEIACAINDAIVHYQAEPYAFTQSRTQTVNTVLGQYVYSATDAAWIGKIRKFDALLYLANGWSAPLKEIDPVEVERLNSNGTLAGEPLAYAYYDKSLLIYPVPSGVYTLRFMGRVAADAPAADGELNNPWMIEGERIIRQKAKWLLAKDIIHDDGLAQRIETPLLDAEAALSRAFNQRRKGEDMSVTPTQF